MKNNLYIFSNTILRRKDNTLLVETLPDSSPIHEADIDESESEYLISCEPALDGNKKKYIPAENIESIYTFGDVRFNSRLLGFVSKHYIPIHVFSYYGKYTGSFLPKSEISSGNIVLLQTESYKNNYKRLILARKFISGAAKNSISNLQYYLYRNIPLDEEVSYLKNICNEIENVASVGELMGIEGNIKSSYYRCWTKIFKQDVEFTKRVKRPPDNMINSLISFGNVMLYSICLNEIYRTGLLPSIGFLHSPGDNRFPLSFDIAEVFKPLIVDKTIFRVINLDMIDEKDFFRKGDSLYMKDKTRKTFVEAIENRLKTTVLHNELKRHVTYKTLIRLECYNVIKHLKSQEVYSPYIPEP
ncbi:MAG: type I-B CRISPR-associated endonuclease Cas1 [Ignavibacteria bacterium]|nr:type I-B CRISPR-associated endonuclease Cas1 [Ignavibacteria bacterium]